MNVLKSACLFLFALALSVTAFADGPYRTDINPALLYHQAFALKPEFSQTDRDYLFVPEWRGRVLDERFQDLVGRYGKSFKMLRRAALARVPCDWGLDMADGPETLLPGLAQVKSFAQTARLRVMWHLQNGRQADARDDLLATFALGRNVSKDGLLISALVQIAVENIIGSIVAENFYQFTPETLKQLADGIDAAPARGTIAQCIAVEKSSFHDWLLRKVEEFQKENPNDDAKVLEQIRQLTARTVDEGTDANEFADKLVKAAGGTSAGVVKLVRDMEPLFTKVTEILQLPPAEFEQPMKEFSAMVTNYPNPFIAMSFSAFEKCRQREFAVLARLAMLRAAVEYKLHGEQGFKAVKDPFGNGPLSFRRFVFNGVDRGFELKSAYKGRSYDEVFIFVEKSGPPFRLDGPKAGEAIPTTLDK